jgi:hypothetical protein
MTRQTFFIISLIVLQVIIQLFFSIVIDNYLIREIVGLGVPAILIITGLSCLTNNGFKFWNKKIKFKRK